MKKNDRALITGDVHSVQALVPGVCRSSLEAYYEYNVPVRRLLHVVDLASLRVELSLERE